MGEVVGAAIVSHVPTIMLPQEIRYEINYGKEISLIPGFHKMREELFDTLKPDVVIVLDTHWHTLLEYVVTAHPRRTGKYTSEELPRGMSQVPYDLKGDPELANLIAEVGTSMGVRTTACDDPCLPINYGTVNVAHYLEQGEAWLSIGCPMTSRPEDDVEFGQALGEAIKRSGKKVVILASGSMSHTFYPMKELLKYESSDPKNVFPGCREADEKRLDWFYQGNHAAVIDAMPEYAKAKPEAGFSHYLMMVGAIGGRDCKAIGRLFSDYENSVGTSQVHVWFDKPEQGWS